MEDSNSYQDHRLILDKMAQQEHRMGEVLAECRSIRADMRDSVLQGRDDAKADRERMRSEVGDLHERINEVKTIADANRVRLEATTDELNKVRSSLTKVTLGLVGAVISAVIAGLIIGG